MILYITHHTAPSLPNLQTCKVKHAMQTHKPITKLELAQKA